MAELSTEDSNTIRNAIAKMEADGLDSMEIELSVNDFMDSKGIVVETNGQPPTQEQARTIDTMEMNGQDSQVLEQPPQAQGYDGFTRLVKALSPRLTEAHESGKLESNMAMPGITLEGLKTLYNRFGPALLDAFGNVGAVPMAMDRSLGKGREFTESLEQINRGMTGAPGEVERPGGIVQQIATDPSLLPSIASGGLVGAGRAGAGMLAKAGQQALRGGVEGLTSAGIHQGEVDLAGGDASLTGAGLEAGLGAVAPGALGLAGKGLSKLAPAIRGFANQLSGISEDALKMYGGGFGKGAKKIKAMAGRQREVGKNLLNHLENDFDKFLKAEKAIVNKAVLEMPPMSIGKIVKSLENSKFKGDDILPDEKSANRIIDEYITALKGPAKPKSSLILPKGLKIPEENKSITASKYLDLRKRLDRAINFDKDGSDLANTAIRNARGMMREQLEKASVETGNPEYIQAMASWSNKLGKRNALLEKIGKSGKTRDNRIEAFVSNIFGKNKEHQQEALSDLTEILGKDFMEESRVLGFANEFGLTKDIQRAKLLPMQYTGARNTGLAIGGTMAGSGAYTNSPALMAVGAGTMALSSPIGASAIPNIIEAGVKGSKLADLLESPKGQATLSQLMRSGIFRGNE